MQPDSESVSTAAVHSVQEGPAPDIPIPVHATSTLTPTTSPTGEPVSTPVATGPPASICSPLEGFNLQQLEEAVFNPYSPPRPGSDDPHQGVDFAVQPEGWGFAVEGHPVQAVLPGSVAAVIRDRFPYGNAVMVETPLGDLPAEWISSLDAPGAAVPPAPPALTCPDLTPPSWDAGRPSLYVLYAHMQSEPAVSPGDRVPCGAEVGAIGSSGNSLNPHLHLEMRLGPGGARFASIAHYDSGASPEEMSNYCAWRVLGSFHHVDPMQLLENLE